MPNQIPDALLPTLPEQPQASVAAQPSATPQASEAPQSPYSVPLLQVDTNHIVPVEQDEADVAIRSGLYAPKNDAEFIVLDKYGNRNVVQGAHLKSALEGGLRLESTAERHERELQENYGGASGIAQSFGAGAARGATFGLSDLTAAGSPEAQQHLSNLEEANPISSALGEVTGFLGGSLLGSTEGSVAARGAGAVVTGAEKLGAKAGQVIEKAIIKDASKVGLSKKVGASIASKMAQEATIGSLVGAGNLVSEAALGKADVNAENLAAAVGMGALIGGAFGATLGAAESALPLVKQGLKPITDMVGDFSSREKAALEISGYTSAKSVKLGQKNPQMVKDLPDWLVNEVGIKAGDDSATLLKKVEDVHSTSGKNIGNSIDEYDRILSEKPELGVDRKKVYFNLADEIDKKFLRTASESPESRAKLAQAGKYYDELLNSAMNSKGPMSLRELQESRKAAYDLGYTSTGAPVETLEGQMARFAGRYYSDALKQAAERVSNELGDKALYSRFIQDHKNFTYASELLPKLRMKVAKSESINPIVASVLGAGAGSLVGDDAKTGAGVGALAALGARSFLRSDLRRNLVVLGKIERANQKAAQLIDKASKSLVSAPVKASPRVVPYSIMQSEFAKRYENGKYKKPQSVSEAYSNLNDNFARYTQDPEAFTGRVNRTTASMYSSAPNTSTAVDSLAVTSAMFLGSKLPKRTAGPGMLDVFKKPRPPSSYDMAKFERYLGAVEHPETVFRDMEHGKLSHEAAEALRTVYPNLFQQLRDKTMEHIGKNPKMPFNRKMQLGILLDIPTDESLLPQNIIGLQSTFSQQTETQGVNPTQKGLSEIDKAGRMETDTQDEGELG